MDCTQCAFSMKRVHNLLDAAAEFVVKLSVMIAFCGFAHVKVSVDVSYLLRACSSLLIDEMKSEDAESRIAAMRKLRVIAGALGPERTRKELVPFLNGSCCRRSTIFISLFRIT